MGSFFNNSVHECVNAWVFRGAKIQK